VQRCQQGIIYIDEIERSVAKTKTPLSLVMCLGKAFSRRYLRFSRYVANVPPQGGRKHPHQEFTPVDTTNILFICGGAFVGLEFKVIGRRVGTKSMGL